MSAGLMSCVRENSPPTENEEGGDTNTHQSHTSSATDTGKSFFI